MRIGIAFDLAPGHPSHDGPDDRYEEFDKPETVEAIATVLRGEGHEVVLLGDGREFLSRILDTNVDLVWNLAEGEGVGRCREARVPAVLEMLGIPYTGSDPLTLSVCLDKTVAKDLVRGAMRTPLGLAVRSAKDLQSLPYRNRIHVVGPGPWIIKPAYEGSSKGIRARSLADDWDAVLRLTDEMVRDYDQPILVEQFIEGDEVTVGLIGNGQDVEVIGSMRIRPKSPDPNFIYSIEVKRNWDERVEYETPAKLPEDVLISIQASARDAFLFLGCRDVARIDFRVWDGRAYFLEANPLPGLAPDWSDLVILAKGFGIPHADLILRILNASVKRLGLTR